ncbi:MAG: hypothetical protein DWP92_06035 [Armatimonadetes bacterium]|nr:MAG: hypothetical protein DWP92_06035 [Armatimonadota bacterium]
MRTLEEINRDLGSVLDAMIALDDDDFAKRYELLKRQDELRVEAGRFQTDFDEQRPTQDVMDELRSMRKQRDAEVKNQAGRNMMSGPGGSGSAAGAVSAEMVELTLKAKAASPLDGLNTRIAALESILLARGVDPSSAGAQALRHGAEPVTD